MKTIEDMDFSQKRVLLRADFNVSLDAQGNITNDSKIKNTIPTIKELLSKGASTIILMSHLGRPSGHENKYSMDKVAKRLNEIFSQGSVSINGFGENTEISIPSIKGDVVKIDMDGKLPEENSIVLLENLRFYREEEADDDDFAKKLAALADVYVNDAFGTCHRRHASVHAITYYLPACAGLLVSKEVKILGDYLRDPKRPLVAIIGAAKVSSKIGILKNLAQKVDKIILGGAIVFTFMKSLEFEVGSSLVEEAYLDVASDIMVEHRDKIVLPKDFVCSTDAEGKTETRTFDWDSMHPGWMGLDIGPRSIEHFKEILKGAGTVIWNGPMGKFEIDKFNQGTKEIGEFIAKTEAFTIAAGGDTTSAIEKNGLQNRINHISTGGGSSLVFLEGKELPALKALEENAKRFG